MHYYTAEDREWARQLTREHIESAQRGSKSPQPYTVVGIRKNPPHEWTGRTMTRRELLERLKELEPLEFEELSYAYDRYEGIEGGYAIDTGRESKEVYYLKRVLAPGETLPVRPEPVKKPPYKVHTHKLKDGGWRFTVSNGHPGDPEYTYWTSSRNDGLWIDTDDGIGKQVSGTCQFNAGRHRSRATAKFKRYMTNLEPWEYEYPERVNKAIDDVFSE